MKRLLKWVKYNWKDPVWNKVFAGVILVTLTGIGSFALSLFKQIPINDLYNKSITTYVQINYFSVIITALILLSLLISAIWMDLIHFQLKKIKFPSHIKSQKFDLKNFLKGHWFLRYKHSQPEKNGDEPVEFINGNQYYIDKELIFVLTDIVFDESKKELEWTKTNYVDNKKHSREILKITDENTIIGIDDDGFSINYKRTTK